MRLRHRLLPLGLGLALSIGALVATALPAAAATDAEVTVGSTDPFSGNKQNEPAVAIDPNHHNLLVAGANDNIDMEDCNTGDDTTCPFTLGVGSTGIQFSTDSGVSWNQPTFTGYSARNCIGVNEPPGVTPTDACVPDPAGPIGTLPLYSESGVVSDGDPAMAWGPAPIAGAFSWSNGSRLYFANLTSNFSSRHSESQFKGVEAIGVSRVDVTSADPTTQATQLSTKTNWMSPALIGPGGAGFADKEQIWADNAASSTFFGNVYVCFGNFVGGPSAGSNAVRLTVARSTDGGDTWSRVVVEQNTNSASGNWALAAGATGCTMRTDSEGTVYLLWHGFNQSTKEEAIFLSRSLDGGATFEARQKLFTVHPTGVFDPVIGRNSMDGLAGARSDLSTSPSVDIANGAPTGVGATNQIVLNWVDGQTLNDEHVMFSTSANGGSTWTTRISVETNASDRGYYTATAISPDGQDVWLVYNAFTSPYQPTTSTPRPLLGVVAHADVIGGIVGSFTEMHRSAAGDARDPAKTTHPWPSSSATTCTPRRRTTSGRSFGTTCETRRTVRPSTRGGQGSGPRTPATTHPGPSRTTTAPRASGTPASSEPPSPTRRNHGRAHRTCDVLLRSRLESGPSGYIRTEPATSGGVANTSAIRVDLLEKAKHDVKLAGHQLVEHQEGSAW